MEQSQFKYHMDFNLWLNWLVENSQKVQYTCQEARNRVYNMGRGGGGVIQRTACRKKQNWTV